MAKSRTMSETLFCPLVKMEFQFLIEIAFITVASGEKILFLIYFVGIKSNHLTKHLLKIEDIFLKPCKILL